MSTNRQITRSLTSLCALGLLACSAACGDDAPEPVTYEGVLSVEPWLVGDASAAGLVMDASVAVMASDAMLPDAVIAVDAQADARPDATRPAEEITTSTTPGVQFVYVGTSYTTPPIEFVASNLKLENLAGDLGVDWMVRIKSKLSTTYCSMVVNADLKDKNGVVLFNTDLVFDMLPHITNASTGGTSDCISPNDVINGWGAEFLTGKGAVKLSDVARIEWKTTGFDWRTVQLRADDVAVSNLTLGTSVTGRTLKGHVRNKSSAILKVFSVDVWILNAGDMPLDHVSAYYEGNLGGLSEWDFTTASSKIDFGTEDVEVYPSYIR